MTGTDSGAQQGPQADGQDDTAKLTSWRIPDTFVIMFVLALLAWAATFLFTPGQFEVAGDPARIVPGSFQSAAETAPAPIMGDADTIGFLDFLFAGLISGDRYSPTIGLMALLLVIGGAFGMMMRTRAVDAAMLAALPNGKAQNEWLILSIFAACSLGGATMGMSEESIALTLVLAPALARAGYDGMTAILTCFVGTSIGFGTSWMNPFNVIIAQSIADLAPMSGLGLRLPMWAGFTVLGGLFLWRYARAVRLRQRQPIGLAHADEDDIPNGSDTFNLARKLILLTLIVGIGWVGWGVAAQGYYLAEITAQFFAMGIAFAMIARIAGLEGCSLTGLMEAFRDGSAQLLPAVIIVAAAKGVLLLLGGDSPTSLSLLNTLLNALSSVTALVPDWFTAGAMFAVQSVINFFITSGSGQAGITMPIMAPLADLSGVSRQTAVLAFQLGDGLTNLIVPTSPVLIGCLTAAGIQFGEWLRFFWKPMLGLMGIALILILAAHGAGF